MNRIHKADVSSKLSRSGGQTLLKCDERETKEPLVFKTHTTQPDKSKLVDSENY